MHTPNLTDRVLALQGPIFAVEMGRNEVLIECDKGLAVSVLRNQKTVARGHEAQVVLQADQLPPLTPAPVEALPEECHSGYLYIGTCTLQCAGVRIEIQRGEKRVDIRLLSALDHSILGGCSCPLNS